VRPRPKPTELAAIQATADFRSVWQAGVGSAGEFTFSPAVVGDSVYAAARDGSLARFDAGRQVWRIAAGQTISGGVGSDGKLVVVGTPKGEVLAFEAATGRETLEGTRQFGSAGGTGGGRRVGGRSFRGFARLRFRCGTASGAGFTSAARRPCRCARASA
jgi:outer membrane protein assembly factor BamB